LNGEAKDMFQYHLLVEQLEEQESNIDQQTSKAKDFTLEDQNENPITLSAYVKNSQYTLVSFWASWDNNSRINNIEYLKLSKRYNKKQFNILSVSLDDSKLAWTNAIAADGINKWTNVSDLKRWNSVVVKLYNLKTIPQNILLDSQNNILGRNLSLEQIINIINSK
ncbi:MAG: TlpA family protein disulfide reductase, partial [Bacteroidales bacterium]|nr:TlpA family protein disulfide reductase [Bacteroidales bacterium]